MDLPTAAAYKRHARAWIGARDAQPLALRRLIRFARELPRGGWVGDLGCGPGWYAEELRSRGFQSVALDLEPEMLRALLERAPAQPALRADLAALPIARGALAGAWALNCYSHLPESELPSALAHLHDAVALRGPVALTLTDLGQLGAPADERRRGIGQRRFADDRFGDRLFTALDEGCARALLEGAGFEDVAIDHPYKNRFWMWIAARRADTLPDYVRPDLDLLVCGLNPSPHAARTGIPFGRPGNRFWPAARAARLVGRERDPWDALRRGIGLTDLAKRVTTRASELEPAEYAAGLARVEQLVRLWRPAAVCFVGLDGWRRAADRGAQPGPLEGGFGGRPAYLMPSTSGLNTHSDVAALARHLRRALRLTRRSAAS